MLIMIREEGVGGKHPSQAKETHPRCPWCSGVEIEGKNTALRNAKIN